MGYGKQTEHTSSGLSDTFQTMGRQSDFCPNHKWVICNYPKKKKKTGGYSHNNDTCTFTEAHNLDM